MYVGGSDWFTNGYVFKSGYPSSSQVVLTNIVPQDSKIKRWLSWARSDALNGGAIIYEFSYSADYGSSWSGWLALSDANLLAVPCAGDGRDRLRIRLTMSSSNHDATPVVDWISLDYDCLYSRIKELSPSQGLYFNYTGKIIGESAGGEVVTNALSHTELRIKHKKSSTFWNGNAWVFSTNTWIRSTGLENWEYEAKNINWTYGDEYYVQSCAVDNKGERETLGAGKSFVVVYSFVNSSFCNYPNPFDPNRQTTCIEYLLAGDDEARIMVFDVRGGLVKEWNFSRGAEGGRLGINRIFWDGKNDKGYIIANGVYFCYLKTGSGKYMTKIMVVK